MQFRFRRGVITPCGARPMVRERATMSVRRGPRAPAPTAALPGTLCGPALALAAAQPPGAECAKRVISPSKPIKPTGLFGGVQRMTSHTSNHLMESICQFKIFAGHMTERGFQQATSYENAVGVYATISLGCNYRPSVKLNFNQMELMVMAGLRKLTDIAIELFTAPLRDRLMWNQLAHQLSSNLRAKVDDDDNPPKVKKDEPFQSFDIADAHLLTPEEIEDGKKQKKREWREARGSASAEEGILWGASVETSASTFLPFSDYFNITRVPDGRVSSLPVEFALYATGLFDELGKSERVFGTVCMKGTQVLLSLEQNVEDLLGDEDKRRVDELATMLEGM